MSAELALQVELVAALRRLPAITGVFDGAPARAVYPYVTIDCSTSSDWGHKTAAGREVLVAVTLWDDQRGRLYELGDAAESAIALVSQVPGWSLVNLRFRRKRVVRDVGGPWAVALDYRARLLQL